MKSRLSALASSAAEVKDRLENLDAERAALLQEAEHRATLGLLLNDYQQHLLNTYTERHHALHTQLATVEKETIALEERFDPLRSIADLASNVFFDLDQFVGIETSIPGKGLGPEEDDTLRPLPRHMRMRSDDLLPFLQQPLLYGLSRPANKAQLYLVLPVVQYSSISLDPAIQECDTLSNYVSMWILRSVQCSWWSFIRMFTVEVDEGLSRGSLETYLNRTWFQADSPAYQDDLSEDPEISGSSNMPQDNMSWSRTLLFTHGTPEVQQGDSQRQRRHSSINSLDMKATPRDVNPRAHTE